MPLPQLHDTMARINGNRLSGELADCSVPCDDPTLATSPFVTDTSCSARTIQVCTCCEKPVCLELALN